MKLYLYLSLSLIVVSCGTFSHSDKKAAELYLQLGSSQLDKGHAPLALKSLRLALKEDPENPMIYNQLGITYFILKQPTEAIQHFEYALKLNPQFTEARNNLARSYIEVGNSSVARSHLHLVLKDLTYIGVAKAQMNYGLSYFKEQNYTVAIQYFQKSIRIEKDNCLAYYYYGRSLYELQDYRSALPVFDTAIPLCKRDNFDEANYYGALSYYKSGDRMKGIALMNETVLNFPNGEYQDKAKNMIEVMKLHKL